MPLRKQAKTCNKKTDRSTVLVCQHIATHTT